MRSQEGLKLCVSFSPGLSVPVTWLGRKSSEGSIHYNGKNACLLCGCAVLLRKQPESREGEDGHSRVTEIKGQRMTGN